MSTLTKKDTSTFYNGTNGIDQIYQDKTYSFPTKGTYVDKNIDFKIHIPGIVIPTPSSGTTQFYITIGGNTYWWKVDSFGNVWVDSVSE